MQALQRWLHTTLPGAEALTPASSDASFRRYFRTERDGTSVIVMDAPPPQENVQPFVYVAQWLEHAGLPAPRVHAVDIEQGFLLLDDLGATTFLEQVEAVGTDDAARLVLYRDAVDLLVRLQQADRAIPLQVPMYDADLLVREIDLFRDWYVQRLCAAPWRPADERHFAAIKQQLLEAIRAQPQGLVHRDYHSRNLMRRADGSLAMIDFQDAVRGALSYDLISLLRDSYITLTAAEQAQLRDRYLHAARHAGLLPAQTTPASFARDCAVMATQRHLKVVGIFARLWLRDGKDQYLRDIPRTRDALAAAAADVLEPADAQWLRRHLERSESV